MNLQDDTIQLLVDLVEKEQRRLDQFQPALSAAATSTSFSGPVSSWVWLWAVSPFCRTGKS